MQIVAESLCDVQVAELVVRQHQLSKVMIFRERVAGQVCDACFADIQVLETHEGCQHRGPTEGSQVVLRHLQFAQIFQVRERLVRDVRDVAAAELQVFEVLQMVEGSRLYAPQRVVREIKFV